MRPRGSLAPGSVRRARHSMLARRSNQKPAPRCSFLPFVASLLVCADVFSRRTQPAFGTRERGGEPVSARAGSAVHQGRTAIRLRQLSIEFPWLNPSGAPRPHRQSRNRARTNATGSQRSPKEDGAGVSALFDDERNSAGRFGARQYLLAVGFAVQLEPVGQTNDDILPRHVFAEALFQCRAAQTRFTSGACFEARLEVGFNRVELCLAFADILTQGDNGADFELRDLLGYWLAEGNYSRGFRLLNNVWYGLQSCHGRLLSFGDQGRVGVSSTGASRLFLYRFGFGFRPLPLR